jgi:hypothetical protein
LYSIPTSEDIWRLGPCRGVGARGRIVARIGIVSESKDNSVVLQC